MYKKTITYTDYNGEERTEDFYFNLTKAELSEMELSTAGGMEGYLKKIIAEKDQKELVAIFKKIILASYGEKSLDGKRFIKNDELRESFTQTEAYSELFMELVTSSDAAANFLNGIIPKDVKDKIEENK